MENSKCFIVWRSAAKTKVCQASVAHLGEPELQLQDTEHMLDLAAHPRLGPVPRPLGFVHPVLVPAATLRAVPRPRRDPANRLRLPLVGAVAPHPRLFAMQQLRQ